MTRKFFMYQYSITFLTGSCYMLRRNSAKITMTNANRPGTSCCKINQNLRCRKGNEAS
jgi:hypothetical protein